mmetsp:Transcript_65039/g.144579  ORF Transcript_65039/g.144579 Transcript_65039/m.144579 type:complete len:505 (+) Transcript_65039:71-1585(+)
MSPWLLGQNPPRTSEQAVEQQGQDCRTEDCRALHTVVLLHAHALLDWHVARIAIYAAHGTATAAARPLSQRPVALRARETGEVALRPIARSEAAARAGLAGGAASNLCPPPWLAGFAKPSSRWAELSRAAVLAHIRRGGAQDLGGAPGSAARAQVRALLGHPSALRALLAGLGALGCRLRTEAALRARRADRRRGGALCIAPSPRLAGLAGTGHLPVTPAAPLAARARGGPFGAPPPGATGAAGVRRFSPCAAVRAAGEAGEAFGNAVFLRPTPRCAALASFDCRGPLSGRKAAGVALAAVLGCRAARGGAPAADGAKLAFCHSLANGEAAWRAVAASLGTLRAEAAQAARGANGLALGAQGSAGRAGAARPAFRGRFDRSVGALRTQLTAGSTRGCHEAPLLAGLAVLLGLRLPVGFEVPGTTRLALAAAGRRFPTTRLAVATGALTRLALPAPSGTWPADLLARPANVPNTATEAPSLRRGTCLDAGCAGRTLLAAGCAGRS